MKTISLLTCISHILEKGMAMHSSILAWRIPWTEEPSGLQSMGSQRAGHDWATNHPPHISHVYMKETQEWVTQMVA